jgi:hypothetical protein
MGTFRRHARPLLGIFVLTSAALGGCASSAETASNVEDVTAGETSAPKQELRFACEASAGQDPLGLDPGFSLFYRTDAPDELRMKAFWGNYDQADYLAMREGPGRFVDAVGVDAALTRPGAPVYATSDAPRASEIVGASFALDEERFFVTGPSFEGSDPAAAPASVVLELAGGEKVTYPCRMSNRSDVD